MRLCNLLIVGFLALVAACGRQPNPPASATVPSSPPTPNAASHALRAATAKPAPDRSVPLDRYTALTDKSGLHTLVLAFGSPPPTDDALAYLVPELSGVSDAFARHDVLAKHRSDVDARLNATRAQRYYRFDTATAPALNGSIKWDWRDLRLQPYDFATKSFSILCFQTSSLTDEATPSDNALDAVHFAMDPNARCTLPVSDESVARAVEAARSAAPLSTLKARAVLYFFVTDARVSFPSIINATLVHVDLTLLDPTDASGARELAHLSFDP